MRARISDDLNEDEIAQVRLSIDEYAKSIELYTDRQINFMVVEKRIPLSTISGRRIAALLNCFMCHPYWKPLSTVSVSIGTMTCSF